MDGPPLLFLNIIPLWVFCNCLPEETVVQFFAYVFCPKNCTKTWILAKYSFLPMFLTRFT